MHDLRFHLNRFREDPIYAVLGEEQSAGQDNISVTEALLEGGVRIIQYRDKTKTTRQKYDQCKIIRELTARWNATFIVNDSVELALAVDADGIHVGQKDLPAAEVKRLVPDWMLIGLSVNHEEQWQAAAKESAAHYIGVGPIRATATKTDTEPPITESMADLVITNDEVLPAVMIGGIDGENLPQLIRRGYKRFAMVSALVGAPHIAANAQHLRKEIEQARATMR